MSTAVIDADRKIELTDLNASWDIQNPQGQIVGRYLPEEEYRKMLYELAEACCPYSEEDFVRFRKETGKKTLSDLWKKLGVTP